MNKKGDVPVTILVLGVLLVCLLALLSFFYSTIQTQNLFVGINLLEKASVQIEKNLFLGIERVYSDTEYFSRFFREDVLAFSVNYVP